MMATDYQALYACLIGIMNKCWVGCVVGPSEVCKSLKTFEILNINIGSSKCALNHDGLIESSVYVGGTGKI